jgi:hypothetical protein
MPTTDTLARTIGIITTRVHRLRLARSTRADQSINCAGSAKWMLAATAAVAALGGLGAVASPARAFLVPPPVGYLGLALPYPGDPYEQCNLYNEPGGSVSRTMQVTGTYFPSNALVQITLQSVAPYYDEWGDVIGYRPTGFYSAWESWTSDRAGNVSQMSGPNNQPFPEIRSTYPPYFYLNSYAYFQATGSAHTFWVTRPAASNIIECGDWLPPAW